MLCYNFAAMNYYCIMVKTGGEEEFKADAMKKASQYALGLQFWFFKRKLRIGGKQNGRVIDAPLFPGYVFMSAENMDAYLFEKIKTAKNFYHFLSSNMNITSLRGNDLECLHHLIRFGESSGFSRALFDANDRIVIIDGVLSGFKGNIISVNRRKQRVKVRIEMCGSINTIDLGYEYINKIPSGQ